MKIIFSPQCLKYENPGHPESPLRVKLAYQFLKQKGLTFIEPAPCKEEDVLAVHSQGLLDAVQSGQFSDADTPNLKGIFEHASLAAGSAIQAQERALKGENAFSLMRPPGHHAGKDTLGGFCYFNNIAIAMKKALKKVKKGAILDLDCHHGNGTQDIFLGNERVLYVSLHQSPLYPGTGLESEENCLNYPLPAGTDGKRYLATLAQALKNIKAFDPELLGISLGFDTYREDPLTNFGLEIAAYRDIGALIKELSIAGFGVLEGGYSQRLGECILEFLSGWE
ncbi:MAG: hypothetical protein A2Y00_07865 [Omnitrophica WOR_2 bacterium GWF2_43_52]|nr:MAG: hypothetical protein A2Y01_04395 [Omnitrophica WOR_2 bacterium GWC2_44_8]OGX21357.1 MAG: hypothetical protein A2Y00_07865 [Omnitrophica WOR_2 bacterium GWF2_43_52]OGX58191.1 MAG: hypothetical protein A2460_00085 [Omnitrophica WOR_2 bacterium RIFOXYC2_FULL_43_9]HAH22019.1 histone deacetylase [Candidatus Omnitrophota bacterium]HBG62696.1 histone deacetylase [Candidatus Omnitrophota bacterium]